MHKRTNNILAVIEQAIIIFNNTAAFNFGTIRSDLENSTKNNISSKRIFIF